MPEGFRTSKKRGQAGIQNQKRCFIDFGVRQEVLRRVLAAAGAQFSLFQLVAKHVDFGLHFGETLGLNYSQFGHLSAGLEACWPYSAAGCWNLGSPGWLAGRPKPEAPRPDRGNGEHSGPY